MSRHQTRIECANETLSGVSFADPYRWLEAQNEEVCRWQSAQADLASRYVREWPHFDRLRSLVDQFHTERPERGGAMPRFAGGRWFRTRTDPGTSRVQVIVADTPMGEGRVLHEPSAQSPTTPPPCLSWIAPSPDGRTLAIGVCADGSEQNTIQLIDVGSGHVLADSPPHTLMDNWTGGVQWLPDSDGFFFSAITGSAIEFEQRVYLHRRSPVAKTAPLDIVWTSARNYRVVMVSRCGRYAVALEGLTQVIPVAIARLGEASPVWKPFITTAIGSLAGHVIGESYIAVTHVGAPRGRLVSIPLTSANPNDPGTWQELVGESEAVLRTVTPVGELLYLTELVDTYARVRVVDRQGRSVQEVPLPDRGAVSEPPFPMAALLPKGHPDRFMFAFSSLTMSPGIYCHTPGASQTEMLRSPQRRLPDAVVEDRCAISLDGTRIPYHLVRPKNASTTAPQPTLIHAYGGFNVPLLPQFPGPLAAFVAAGGTLVLAHLRGGGEYGLTWWQGGRKATKQNCYDDLYAVAEELIGAGRTTSELLAVTGASNGGLMAGVAVTQRPDLWKAVVPRVPVLDLVGSCRDPYGRMCALMEYADVEDPDEVHRLATFSPYHLVRDGVSYPAVYIDAGDTDPRCPPWHARKFAARLQRASNADAPILLHVWENAGHGAATARNVAVMEHTEWLAFTLRQLGVELGP